ncbi:hypothetical protein CU102_23970 [Phyllobacterium brassicacearum]|uniref:Uncharacterized protein n=1 Tax=Phyllobacterium brassicacearum TaxID=314235 RepID=A0A2P7BA36_9HYPH|nr:hypothetical protein [Phyllobacterium brassicacearum]PSH63326.1 hypothetical protein CU102_23970 [Phyllobacterium brassicacearum]TDQ18174.1 hypothetical protein DEV91_12537 [Phyllobacterium brassicacearum]
MRRVRPLKNLVAVSVAGAALLVLPACAGHKELKAPCSASLAPSAYWSGSAFASVGCGPMLKVNLLNGPGPDVSTIQEM